MAYTNSLHSSSLGCWDLHNLGVLNADISSNMENNAASLALPTADNYSNNFLSTGYLEDALVEFSVRFKRRKLMVCSSNACDDYVHHDPFATLFGGDDLNYWSNWLANYSMQPNEELSHASLLTDQDMHYSAVESLENYSMNEMYEAIVNFPESNTLLSEEEISASSPKLPELSSNSRDNSIKTKSTGLAYSSDTYSTDASSVSDEREKRKKKVNTTSSRTTKMVYPFGLVKPGAEEGDITLNDINRRILMPPTRPLKHPVGDFACRPTVSAHGPGLSGKAVVALTRIQTQGRGTITIIRTKG